MRNNEDFFERNDFDTYEGINGTHLNGEDFFERGGELTEKQYNTWIGGSILYGLVLSGLIGIVCQSFFLNMNPLIFLIGYFICAITGTIIAKKSDNWKLSFVGYNLLVVPIGGVISIALAAYELGSINNALLTTGFIVGCMMALSNIKPNLFKGMGTTLGVVLLISLVVEIFCLLVGISTGFFDFLFVIVFSLYIGYDWYKAQQLDRTKDNAIDVALEIYLDIINLFLRLLSLFGKRD